MLCSKFIRSLENLILVIRMVHIGPFGLWMHILSTPTFNNNLNCLSKNWKMPIRILGEIYIYTTSATYLRQQQTLQKYNTQKQNKKCVNYYEHSENLDLHYIFIVDTSNYQVIIKAISPGIPIRIVILTSYYSIIYLSIRCSQLCCNYVGRAHFFSKRTVLVCMKT